MQNYVYRSREEALASLTGRFDLRACPTCGFAFNAEFDKSLLTYDENYDNLVPSKVIEDYYRQIAGFLYDNFNLANGTLIEIGCGKGAFLNILCRMYPDVEAIGLDPSYEPDDRETPSNVRFVQEIFDGSQITQKPSLILCRHVLEHIARPRAFLESIRDAVIQFPGTPFFIEVPELEWILENDAFWDFCYEHCNYFTQSSLKNTVELAGLTADKLRKDFGDQYLWVTGTFRSAPPAGLEDDQIVRKLTSYSDAESHLMEAVKDKLVRLKKNGHLLVVWGMATKGVVFCNLIDPEHRLFDFCIDINENKSGCFVPHTGHRIDSPETFVNMNHPGNIIVIVMNPNYIIEIERICSALNLTATFIDAVGNMLAAHG